MNNFIHPSLFTISSNFPLGKQQKICYNDCKSNHWGFRFAAQTAGAAFHLTAKTSGNPTDFDTE